MTRVQGPKPSHPFASPGLGSVLDDCVVPGTAVERIEARPADEDIVAFATREHIVACAADEDIVVVSAVGVELDRAGQQGGAFDDIVAAKGPDIDQVARGVAAGDGDP